MKDHMIVCLGRLTNRLVNEPYSPAGTMFELHGLFKLMESELEDVLMDKFPWWAVDNYWFDPYDSSIEFKFVPESWAPVQYQLDALKEYGFSILFLNYADGASARMYRLPSIEWSRCNNNAGKGNVLS